MAVRDLPLFTDVYDNVGAFSPHPGSAYVFRRSVEARSLHVDSWAGTIRNVSLVSIEAEEKTSIDVGLGGSTITVKLRSELQLIEFWKGMKQSTVYLDITGMRHHVWAALLRTALKLELRVTVVYVEPEDYRPSLAPTEGEIYDLSERIEGISPLPGFARLREPGDRTCFVPLLGFEGTRFAYLLEQIEPPGDKIVPIIGVPGFRPEYPFATYLGNQGPLAETKAWHRVRFAAANCPFSLIYRLREIEAQFQNHVLKIAPIGTKPHAIGAVVYAVLRPDVVELVYDHPIRRAQRTEGTARLLAYHVWCFVG